MLKTTVYLPDADMQALKAAARQRHQSEAELIREGVRLILAEVTGPVLPVVLPALVLAELDYFVLARVGAQAEKTVLAELRSPAYRLAGFTDDDFQLTSEVAIKYGDMQLGLTDASIVVQAARHKTTWILSLDHKHFATVRPLTGGASFTLPPRDDQA